MFIEHIALWTNDLKRSREFYCEHFEGVSEDDYANLSSQFECCFIAFGQGVRLEIMKHLDRSEQNSDFPSVGWDHIAFKLGSQEKVNQKIEYFRERGHMIKAEPRMTGSGAYLGIILDPDGNIIELVA